MTAGMVVADGHDLGGLNGRNGLNRGGSQILALSEYNLDVPGFPKCL